MKYVVRAVSFPFFLILWTMKTVLDAIYDGCEWWFAR